MKIVQMLTVVFPQIDRSSTSTRKVVLSRNAPTAGRCASHAQPTSNATVARRQASVLTCSRLSMATLVRLYLRPHTLKAFGHVQLQ